MTSVVLVILLLFQILSWTSANFSAIKVQNLLIPFTIFSAGLFYLVNHNYKGQPELKEKDYFLAEVCQKPAEKARTYQTVLSVQNKELTRNEKIVAYFDKKNFDSTITTGDLLIVMGKLQKIRNPGNPYEFDYESMMHCRDIWYSIYLNRPAYLKTDHKITSRENWAEKLRDYLVDKLAKVLPDKEERSVVSALTLGYRTELDQDTLDYFASTGAMHVLSVSGLHVGLLYMILAFLLGFIKRGKIGRVLFPVVMILFLWIYAFISGFSPPVQRATVMFTFVIVGNELRRPVNIYNSLTASALLLILLDPNVIFDVGFQLSYLAIFGIVLIQPALYNLFTLKNKILGWLWALFTVSIAAQLVTFPLGVFYFNQFPNFFWLSNFVVVPVTTLIMWATLVYFIVVPLHGVALGVGVIIQKLTAFMLIVLKALDAHPLAVTRGLVFSFVEVILVFGSIFALIIFFSTKRKIWLTTCLILLICIQSETLLGNCKLMNQKFLLVYNSKSTVIHLINGRSNYLILSNNNLSEADKKMTQKVIDHCKLKDPVIINRKKTRDIKCDDLLVNPKSILFLNVKIDFINTFRNNTDEFSIIAYPESEPNKPITSFISTAYPQNMKSEKLIRYTRTGGAYQLAIN